MTTKQNGRLRRMKPNLRCGQHPETALRKAAGKTARRRGPINPAPAKQDGHGVPTKPTLLTREALDGRTRARRRFDSIAVGIAQDLGGEDRLSTVQKHLVEAFAGAAVHVHDLNARLLLGEKVNLLEHSTAISTMVRIASRIGTSRVAKEAPSLAEYLASKSAAEPSDATDEIPGEVVPPGKEPADEPRSGL